MISMEQHIHAFFWAMLIALYLVVSVMPSGATELNLSLGNQPFSLLLKGLPDPGFEELNLETVFSGIRLHIESIKSLSSSSNDLHLLADGLYADFLVSTIGIPAGFRIYTDQVEVRASDTNPGEVEVHARGLLAACGLAKRCLENSGIPDARHLLVSVHDLGIVFNQFRKQEDLQISFNLDRLTLSKGLLKLAGGQITTDCDNSIEFLSHVAISTHLRATQSDFTVDAVFSTDHPIGCSANTSVDKQNNNPVNEFNHTELIDSIQQYTKESTSAFENNSGSDQFDSVDVHNHVRIATIANSEKSQVRQAIQNWLDQGGSLHFNYNFERP